MKFKIEKGKIVVPIIIGIISFLIIYGITSLNVSNINWIIAGYDENDIIQHYAGWSAYRNSDWAFPLSMAYDMGVGVGTMITFTDSIPLVAIILKIFNGILPETFQFFGIYTLMCYILQAHSAYKIIYFKTKDFVYSTIGVVLFSFSPILIERAFRHTALGSQFLILYSIYLFIKYKEEKSIKTWLLFLLLEVLSVGLHPYFLPMVACFAFLCMILDIKDKKRISILYFVAIQIITYFFGFLIGALGNGINASRWGYGYYSMNLNAIINPTSLGKYTWSRFLKIQEQILGNYDGFNYLGLGIILFLIIDIFLIVYFKKGGLVKDKITNNWALLVVCIFLTFFAVSNVVTFNGVTLFTIPFPDSLVDLCGIFRASSRMFYPVYYILYFSLIIILWESFKGKKNIFAYGVLILVVSVQLVDISGCIIEKHQRMLENADYHSYIEDETLAEIAKLNQYVILDDFGGERKKLSVWAYENNLKTYFEVANSGFYDDSYWASDKIDNFRKFGDTQGSIIVTTNEELAARYDEIDNIDVYEQDDMFFIFDNSLQTVTPNR